MKRRTAGRWSFDERYIQFAAAGLREIGPTSYLVAVNDLMGARGPGFLESVLNDGYRVLLDSGVFNLTNEHMRATGGTMNDALALAPDTLVGFGRLFDRYVELASAFGERLWGYIELDQGGADNKRRTRARLHELGLDPIPVYHPVNDGWDYFDELASQFDRICVGNIVQASVSERARILHTIWERRRAYPDLWIHALGLTPSELCLPFPPDSCDSSSWLSGMRWPKVYLGTMELKAIRANSDPGFRYAMRAPNDESAMIEAATETDSGDAAAALHVYADEVEFTTLLWRRIVADRAAELGEDTAPAYIEGEGALCPSRAPKSGRR